MSMSEHVESARTPIVSSSQPEPRIAGCTVPLTALQRIWLKYINDDCGGLGYRVCYMALRLVGPLSVDCLRRSLEFATQRQESLRTRIVAHEGDSVQVIDSAWMAQLEIVDVSNAPALEAGSVVTRLCEEFLREKVDPSVGPLFVARLFRLSNHEHVLLLALDHLIADGTSLAILEHEIWTLYEQATQGLPLALPELPLQFADYAVWEQQTYANWLKRHGPYWKNRMTGAPRINVPIDGRLAMSERPASATFEVLFGGLLSDQLRALARREHAALPVVVLAVYAITMSQWCERKELVINLVSHGRHRPELESMVGLLIVNLLLRIEVNDTDTFVALLDRLNTEFREAVAHEDFNRASHLVPECSTELGFNWLPTTWQPPLSEKTEEGRLAIQVLQLEVAWSWPLSFWMDFYATPAGIVGRMIFRPDRISRYTVEALGRTLMLLSERFTQDPLATLR